MKPNYLLSDAIISPLGFSTSENLTAIKEGQSALNYHSVNASYTEGIYSGLISEMKLNEDFSNLGSVQAFSKLEKMFILAISKILIENPGINLESTGLVIATTKGNIDQLGQQDDNNNSVFLWRLAQKIGEFFNFTHKPIVISNACISGSLAIKTANDLIKAGKFSRAIVAAGDLVSDFVISGFSSFQAISPSPCRPFSNDRNGISLGEAAAAILIDSEPGELKERITYVDGIVVNDANHISGPSRDGEGLYLSLKRLLDRNKIGPGDIDYLSAHGTATLYNDEMESVAFSRAGLRDVPVNSFKGYYGHSLGASALVESILTKHSLLNNELYKSLNYTACGTTHPLNIIGENRSTQLNMAVKTASGFGGCNLSVLLKKDQA